jgi:hypothetical protein
MILDQDHAKFDRRSSNVWYLPNDQKGISVVSTETEI